MASSLQGKAGPELRRVTADEAVVHPEGTRPTDESPTVISKTTPLGQPISNTLKKLTDLARKPTTPDSLIASLRGNRLAHYELIEPIGVGGMAAVIRARDTQLDRFVALKILPPETAEEPENVERFRQEARAAAKLDHENVARVFYCGDDQGIFFIAFEYVEGMNLRTLMEQRGRIPVAEAVRYILQVATGLEHAATRGVVHRDVKPSNIIITPTGRAKLVDMGLARNLERRGEDLTQSGVTLGTFDYISPEQALDPREADSRSDIYSLGCTFYHLLTGMAPVPEGTPAKKLDHHQHHAPTDPRLIDPRIPTEIVMILGKMMAKKPKDRYQRPIHLAQHLMQVAQGLGAANDLPEGGMFVETPLPGQMQKRPALAMGLALGVLVIITLFLSLHTDPTPQRWQTPNFVENKAGLPKPGPGPNPIIDPTPKVRPTVASDRDQLKEIFDDTNAKEIKATIDGKINLETGLVFKGAKDQRLELETADNLDNGTQFDFKKASVPVGLLVEGGEEVIFRKIRFEIDADNVWPKDGVVAAAVTVRGVKTVKFEQCVFAQPKVPPLLPQRGPIASLFIDTPENADHPKPIVILNDCLFDSAPQTGGQVAIAINGAATVNLTNCAFMPHAALIQFRKDCTKTNTNVHLQQCDGFVVHGPAFRFAPKASAQIHARYSVFSRPDGTLSSSPILAALPEFLPPTPSLIFLPDPAAPIEYVGESNLYHNLNLFVERRFNKDGVTEKNEPLINNLSAFQEFLTKGRGSDQNSNEISVSPWTRNSKLELIADLAAFQLKAEYHDRFGMRQSWQGPMPAPVRLVNIPQPAPKVREKIVDADDKGKTPGVRASLGEALAGAEDGDIILIKHGVENEIIIPPIALKPGISVTIKPFKGCEPILLLDKLYNDKDSFLFKVQDGNKLQIENMEIIVDPASALFQMQSIIHLGESGHCVFKNCYLTLRASNNVPLNVVTFVDLDRMVKMGVPNPSSARVEFHECFVRGRGDLVALNGCRLLHVDMKDSLVTLDGSLLDIRAANKAMPMNQGVRWKMERSSVFTTQSIFALKSPAGKGLTITHADIEGCLFASLALKQPIVELGVEEPLEKYLKWKGEQNFYANYDKDSVDDWRRQAWEMKSDYGRLTFAELKDEMIQKLWDATPDWFKPIDGEAERLSEYGVPAVVEKRMMPPSSKDVDR